MEAYEILAEQYRPMLLVYLRTLVRDEHLAEDLTQEVLLDARRRLADFRKGASFGAWLRGMARKAALESRRAVARRRVLADSRFLEGVEEVYAVLDGPDPQAETWAARASVLRDCVESLGGSLRQALTEVYRNGRPLREAAGVLRISFEALAQRLHRARELLLQCMTIKLGGGDAP